MEDTFIAWFAGLFEGEGCFNVLHGTRAKAIAIHMTDLDILQRVQDELGGSLCKVTKRQEHWKEAWRWTLASRESAPVVEAMMPYLGERRRERAEEYLAMIDQAEDRKKVRADEALKFRNEIRQLRETGLTQQAVADKMGVSRSYVGHVLGKKYSGDYSSVGER